MDVKKCTVCNIRIGKDIIKKIKTYVNTVITVLEKNKIITIKRKYKLLTL